MTPEQVLRTYYENANEINAITARRQPTFEEKVMLAKMIGAHLKRNIIPQKKEGAWFDRNRGDEGIYAEPNYHMLSGEIPGPIKGIGQSEVIVAAGIKLKDGRVFTGANHGLAQDAFDNAGYTITDWKRMVDDADVFVTSRGRTLTRKEAVRLTGERSEDAADIIGHDISRSGVKPEKLKTVAKEPETIIYRSKEETGLGSDYYGGIHFSKDKSAAGAYARDYTGSSELSSFTIKSNAKLWDDAKEFEKGKRWGSTFGGGRKSSVQNAIKQGYDGIVKPNGEYIIFNKDILRVRY